MLRRVRCVLSSRLRRPTRWHGCALVVLALTASRTSADPYPLERLAAAVAAAVDARLPGREVVLGDIDDRSGRGLGRDLAVLLQQRLAQRVPGSEGGSEVEVEVAVGETPERLVASARLTDSGSGEVLGLLSVSTPLEPGWIDLRALRRPLTRHAVDVVTRALSGPLSEPVLDLAWTGDALVLLSPTRIRLAAVEGARFEILAEHELPGPVRAVRAPAGLLLASGDDAFWALTNSRDFALLLVRSGSRLDERARAEAPPAVPGLGLLRYRAGTNQLRATQTGASTGIALLRLVPPLAVAPRGELLQLDATPPRDLGVRVGSALALLWKDYLLASTTVPPGAPDALQVLRLPDAAILESLEAPGPVACVAARVRGERADVVAAVEAFGGPRLLVLELARRGDLDLPGGAP